MFTNFPKIRKELSEEYKKIYKFHYEQNRNGSTKATSISHKMEKWMHRKVAADVKKLSDNLTTLEVGAGTLNQLEYETYNIGQYDVIEPFIELYENSLNKKRINRFYSDIKDVPKENKYNRITSIACFEHVLNLPELVACSGMLLKPEGNLRIGIPSEGTLLWGLGWRLTTGIEFRHRYGLDYGKLMHYEHVNTAREIENVLKYFFKDVKISVFGISKALSFYQFISCQHPDIKRCEEYIKSL